MVRGGPHFQGSPIKARRKYLNNTCKAVRRYHHTEEIPRDELGVPTVFASGGAFLLLVIVLALFVPHPTAFQYSVFRVALSLAAAGFAAPIPGFIKATIPGYVEAGGALAVFVVVYYFNPSALVATPP
jgi:hypothetical protein